MHQIFIGPPLTLINNTPVSLKFSNTVETAIARAWQTVPFYSLKRGSREMELSFFSDSEKSDSAKINLMESHQERRFLMSRDPGRVQAVHLTSFPRLKQESSLEISVKWWMVDRTGLALDLFSEKKKIFNKTEQNIWLLPDPDKPICVSLALQKQERWDLTLPDSGHVWGFVGRNPLVIISRETYREKFLEIVPKFTLFNALGEAILVSGSKHEDRSSSPVEVAPETGIPIYHIGRKNNIKIKIRDAWSCKIPLKESAAGIWPLRVGSFVCRVHVAPLEGSVHVTVRPGSTVKVRNEKKLKAAKVFPSISEESAVNIPPLSEREIGWTDPFSHPVAEIKVKVGILEIAVPLARTDDNVYHGGWVVVRAGEEPQSIVIVVLASKQVPVVVNKIMSFEVHVEKLGLSLIRSGSELLYAELALIRSLVRREQFATRIALLVSEIQVENMTTQRAVVLANTGEGVQAFLEAEMEISSNVSKGIAAIPILNVRLDSLFVEVDSDFMLALEACLKEVLDGEGTLDLIGVEKSARKDTRELHPLVKGAIKPVPVSTILILNDLGISALSIELWVDLDLASMRFLPVSLRLIIGMLSLGKCFTLKGAKVLVKRRRVSGFKGSSAHFIESMMHDYSFEALKNAASLLGSSSLLRIPRAPIKLVTGLGAFGLENATKAVDGMGHLMSNLFSSADTRYRKSQERIRRSKKIKGVADGFVEAATRLGEGVGGVFDIFVVPIKGAKKHGVPGFIKGLGKGLVGTLVKPITKVGEAVGDVGTGIAQSFATHQGVVRDSFARKRIPRAFFGSCTENESFVVDYSMTDAMLFAALGAGMHIIIPCTQGISLVGFPEKLLVVEIINQGEDPLRIEIKSEIYKAQIQSCLALPSDAQHPCILIKDIFNVTSRFELDLALCPETTALVETLLSAISPSSSLSLDWRATRLAFADVCFVACSRGSEDDEGSTKQVEVWEVERFLVTSGWRTPFLFTDSDTRWRWVDSRLKRNPRLDPTISRSETSKFETPPIHFGELWKPLADWKVAVDAVSTDKDGWMYAVSFNSSTWKKAPGVTTSVRKRKWTRSFV
jgi:hypothetical protein